MAGESEQKYGLTHVDTERSMRHDVVSLAGYSIRRGPVPSHAIDSPVSAALAPEFSSKRDVRTPRKTRDANLRARQVSPMAHIEVTMLNEDKSKRSTPDKPWARIPDGTKVRHTSADGCEGFIDGLTEIVNSPKRNPDGKTLYRLNVGTPHRQLAAEADLLILLDQEGLVQVMGKSVLEYRRSVTEQLHHTFDESRFAKIG